MRPPDGERQSFLRYPLSHVLANGSNVRVLRCLTQQRQPLAVSQLARLTGLAPQSVRNVLSELSNQGLLRTLGEVRSRVHDLRTEHPLAPILRALFDAEKSRWDEFLARLQGVLEDSPGVQAAWLYGSVARGEDRPGSDVDLALVVADREDDRVGLLRERLAEFGLEQQAAVSVVVLAPEDLQELARKDSAWWQQVRKGARTLRGEAPESLHERLRRLAMSGAEA